MTKALKSTSQAVKAFFSRDSRRGFLRRTVAAFAGVGAIGAATAEAGAAPTSSVSAGARAADPLLGEIMPVGFNFAPRGWALCDGQLLAISQFSALFSLLGTIYGGDGRTTFALPDLRGRSPMHAGTGPGLTPRSLGQRAGQEQVTLNTTQIPSHTHTATVTINALNMPGTLGTPSGNHLAGSKDDGSGRGTVDTPFGTGVPNTTLAADSTTTTVSNTGGGLSHDNMHPFLVVNFCIALEGVFPSRS